MIIPGTALVKGLAVALSLAPLISSAPSPAKEAIAPAPLAARAEPAARNVTEVTGRDLPGNGADCGMYWDTDWSEAGYTGIHLHMWGQWIQDGGKGFQDNVHGECGVFPMNWVWDRWDDGSAHVDFLVAAQHPNICVQNALWDASRPTGAIWGVKCCWDTYPWCETLQS